MIVWLLVLFLFLGSLFLLFLFILLSYVIPRFSEQPSMRLAAVRLAMGLPVAAAVVLGGAIAVNVWSASRESEPTLGDREAARFAAVEQRWASLIDLPLIRIVLTRAERYRDGSVLYEFRFYDWLGSGSGYATVGGEAAGAGGGGIVSRQYLLGLGGWDDDGLLSRIRERWSTVYGSPDVIVPTTER